MSNHLIAPGYVSRRTLPNVPTRTDSRLEETIDYRAVDDKTS